MATAEGKPKRLRPWLEGLLNRGDIPGLQWIDEERTMFRITWKHHGKQDWSPGHGRIFMEWAKQTGRYREGVDPEDYPRWKTRLRCAIHKASDIAEVREMRNTDSYDPYRVYRFKSPSSNPAHVSASASSAAAELASYHLGDDYQQTTDVAVGSSGAADVKTIKLDLDAAGLLVGDVIGSDVADAGGDACSLAQLLTLQKQDSELDDSASHSQSREAEEEEEEEEELVVTVRYCGEEVLRRTVSGRTGCRLCYDEMNITDQLDDFLPNELGQTLFGPRQAEAIVLPPCENFMNAEAQGTVEVASKMLSRGLQRGLVIQSVNSNIFVYRLCQCAVFYYKQSTSVDAGQTPIKLRRSGSESSPPDATRLFDYDTYVAMLKDYLDERGPKPDPHCVMVLGQERAFCRDDSTLLVAVTVASSRALQDLRKAEAAMASRTPNVLLSASNEFDNLARYMYMHQQAQQQQQLMQQQLADNVVVVQCSAGDERRDADDFDQLPEPDDDLLYRN